MLSRQPNFKDEAALKRIPERKGFIGTTNRYSSNGTKGIRRKGDQSQENEWFNNACV